MVIYPSKRTGPVQNNHHEYQVFKPPMIPILYQMEESINERTDRTDRDNKQDKKKVIPMDTEKVEKKLKLKRVKPKGSATLDDIMGVQLKV